MLTAVVQPSTSGSAVSILALIVAVLSFGVAAAALTWQIVSWLLGAGRARVQLRLGAVSSTGLVTYAVDGKLVPEKAIQDLASEGYTISVLAVSVTSIGRAPISVQSWSAHAKQLGMSFRPIKDMIGDSLPRRLEPGDTYTWATPLRNATALVHAGQVMKDTGGVDEVYVVVELGTGKKIRTRSALRIQG